MDAVGVSLRGQPLYSSDDATALVEDRQFVLGEGPLVATFELRTPIEAPDTTDRVRHRWLQLDLEAARPDAAFAFPVLGADGGRGGTRDRSAARRRPRCA